MITGNTGIKFRCFKNVAYNYNFTVSYTLFTTPYAPMKYNGCYPPSPMGPFWTSESIDTMHKVILIFNNFAPFLAPNAHLALPCHVALQQGWAAGCWLHKCGRYQTTADDPDNHLSVPFTTKYPHKCCDTREWKEVAWPRMVTHLAITTSAWFASGRVLKFRRGINGRWNDGRVQVLPVGHPGTEKSLQYFRRYTIECIMELWPMICSSKTDTTDYKRDNLTSGLFYNTTFSYQQTFTWHPWTVQVGALNPISAAEFTKSIILHRFLSRTWTCTTRRSTPAPCSCAGSATTTTTATVTLRRWRRRGSTSSQSTRSRRTPWSTRPSRWL